jgi:multimeric flavodoxin WrbA
MSNRRLTIFWHSMTGGSEALAKAAARGAATANDVDVKLLSARAASPDNMLEADGYLFVFPENLAAISGEMKAFFDRSYYPCLGRIEGRPYALIICAGSDGQNAARQAMRIATGWRLKSIAETQIVSTHAQTPEAILAPKSITDADLARAHDLGAALAEGLKLGIY